MKLNFEKVFEKAEEYKPAISKFLRDMIAIPSASRQEANVIERIQQEMEAVGFDRVNVDPMGNILGYIGNGRHLIAMDAHVDTVGVGDPDQWEHDPYVGYEDDEIIIGRGASDQEGGMAAMVYAAKIIKDLHLDEDYTLLITGTVQEEDCDGLCWQYIINESNIRPEFVVSTEPTSCRIHRGQRGRMEIKVSTSGVSCHGSAPERGDNAIFKMAPVLNELKTLHGDLKDDDFLGKGSLTVSEIFFSSPSRCAVADGCSISIDRRLTAGETSEFALQQIRNLSAVKETKAQVSMYDYAEPSYTGLVYPTESYFPSWTIAENHPACQTLVSGYKGLYGKDPIVDKWTFSTNGVAITGMFGIPCIGFGPGHEDQSHAPNERTWKSELVKAAAMYAVIPKTYVSKYSKPQ
ncbi:MAG: YgeY family selenium metabolism-linked hydrolase [Desulfobacterales bacterium]|nr:MAG: YgeY family selenium metabolism-linked hydrolase [Desulfobacterales bacterium]